MKRQVLLVEGDKEAARLVADHLEINGFGVALARTAEEASRALDAGGHDAIVLGDGVGGAGGAKALLKEIRETRGVDVPVVVLSGAPDGQECVACLGLGADDYVPKPFCPAELIARVKAHANRYAQLTRRGAGGEGGQGEGQGVLVARNLKIDAAARRAFVRGKEITLTNKEFDLLLFLAQNPNRVLKKADIFDQVWGMDAFGDTSTVTVHIKKLREKVDAKAGKPKFIETVWGTGYRFRA
jgi:DNA-binding response OmpR family regulator